MNIWSFVAGVVGGTLGSSAIVLLIAMSLKERWIENVRANYATELERVKDSLQRDQKSLQARLDHGTYVTQAQYDLELSAYKQLWTALSELRNSARAIQGINYYEIPGTNNEWRETAFSNAITDLHSRHNTALEVSESLAPFYEKGIHLANRKTTYASGLVVQELSAWTVQPSDITWENLVQKISIVVEKIEDIHMLIRGRLTSLRLYSHHDNMKKFAEEI